MTPGAKDWAMTKGQLVLAISCGIEAATGLGLLVGPTIVAKLLFGSETVGIANVVGNVAGIALISLAIACWPLREAVGGGSYFAMLIYNLLVALLLAETGATAVASGIFLWPAVVEHFVFSLLIALALIGSRRGVLQRE
jgi:hypothetical protein